MKLSDLGKRSAGLLVGIIFGALVACGGSSVAGSGSSGLTQADVQQMITAAVAPLQSQIATLQSQIQSLQASQPQKAAVFIRAPNAGMALAQSTRSTQAITRALPSPCNWTLTGRPTSSDPIGDNTYAGISCTGYYFLITGASATDTAGIRPSPSLLVGWDGPNCTGNAYVFNASAGAIVNGFVFTANTTQPGFVGPDANPADYYYVAANTQLAPGVLILSSFSAAQVGVCSPMSGFPLDVYPALQNDPSITGIPSAPVPGPVLISN